jgi:hypothetical protein
MAARNLPEIVDRLLAAKRDGDTPVRPDVSITDTLVSKSVPVSLLVMP